MLRQTQRLIEIQQAKKTVHYLNKPKAGKTEYAFYSGKKLIFRTEYWWTGSQAKQQPKLG
jgi:hypothetical protein